jgi:DNA-binding protein HU-beta
MAAAKLESWTLAPVARKKAIVERMMALTGESKGACSMHYDAVMAAIEYELIQGNQVAMPGIGKFQLKDKPAQLRKDSATGDYYRVNPRRYVKFTFNQAFKLRIRYAAQKQVTPQ